MDTTPNQQTAPKHVLISVVGLSPQIITETLYYYWHLASPPVPITEVFALTTLHGKQILEDTLLGDDGKLKSLCSDYNLPPIHFDLANIQLLKSADGQPLDDISSVIDNEALQTNSLHSCEGWQPQPISVYTPLSQAGEKRWGSISV